MNAPDITTVIPTYRRPVLLRRALESALQQTYSNLIIHVYDNDSRDETEDVVREYMRGDARVAYTQRAENIGPCANMARGVEAVTTPFYSLLNDDDFLLPDFYQQAMDQFSRFPSAMVACAPVVSVDVASRRLQHRNRDWMPGFYEPSDQASARMFRSHFAQPGVLMRKEMHSIIGPFELSGDDRLYMTMAATCRPFVVLAKPGAVFSVHANSYSSLIGLRGTAADEVYEQFVSTLQTILNTDLVASRKVYLLMWALRAYGSTFDRRALSELLSQNPDSPEFSRLPLHHSPNTILRHLIEVSPPKLKPIVGSFYEALRQVRSKLAPRSDSWQAVPEKLQRSLESESVDSAALIAALYRDE